MKFIKKIWNKIWDWIKPYLTPRMIPIILGIWFITNGIWYAIAFAPFEFLPNWLTVFAKAYLAVLWMPFSVEKPIIIAIAVFIYRIIYKEKFVKKNWSNSALNEKLENILSRKKEN